MFFFQGDLPVPRVLKPNQKIRKYTITRDLSKGMFALSYEATDDRGTSVFFKQYKSPMPEVSWYRNFVAYQAEIRNRLQSSGVRTLSLTYLDSFEEKVGTPTFFQVFEFYPKGHDMKECIDAFRRRDAKVPWDRRLVFARVFVSALMLLHESDIVHCDLKPENVYLCEDLSVKAGYRVKLIDLDFSILTTKTAPWHGVQNYVGSPCYLSPEHLTGTIPQPKSDVFTAAIMLYELLGEGHPYPDEETYLKQVHSHAARKIKFQGDLGGSVDAAGLADMLHQALSPDMTRRPNTKELQQSLLGIVSFPPSKDRETEPEPPRPGEEDPTNSGSSLKLIAGPDRELVFSVSNTQVGSSLARQLNEDGRFLDDVQFTIVRRPDGTWVVAPKPETTNETLLNGRPITTETVLKNGDELAVGRASKGIKRLPMKVEIT